MPADPLPTLTPTPGTDADALATPFGAWVLKDEPCTRVERIELAGGAVVRKIYWPRPFLLWRTFLLSSRAAREFLNLSGIFAAGVPCVRPLWWREVRVFGCVAQCEVATEFVPDAPSMKQVLARGEVSRNVLAEQAGRLMRALHQAGFLGARLTPRNLLVQGTGARLRVLLCDLPAAVRFAHSILCRRAANLDVYDLAFSAQRCRDFTRPQRLRLVLAYTAGDQAAARALWQRLAHRRRWVNRLFKGALVGFDSYVRLTARALTRGRPWLQPDPATMTLRAANPNALHA